jgi:hypothetical protein
VAFSVELVNVNPRGAQTLKVDGDTVTVQAEATVTVPPEVAGVAPRWRRATEDEAAWVLLPERPEGKSPMHTRQHAGHLEVFDLGTGLLAQPDNWRKAGDTSDPADPAHPGDQPVDADTPITGRPVPGPPSSTPGSVTEENS